MPDRVWVIDDTPAMADSITVLLNIKGIEARSVTSGAEALGLLAAGVIPRAMVLDVKMPHINGNDIIYEVKNKPEWTFPIIVLAGDTDDIRSELTGRVFKALPKTVDPQELVDTLTLALGG